VRASGFSRASSVIEAVSRTNQCDLTHRANQSILVEIVWRNSDSVLRRRVRECPPHRRVTPLAKPSCVVVAMVRDARLRRAPHHEDLPSKDLLVRNSKQTSSRGAALLRRVSNDEADDTRLCAHAFIPSLIAKSN
jgi:hypothetical protein